MVVKVAEALLERETLDEQEVRDLMFGGVPA
jgi:ATP-dependent Zn protease